MNEMISRLGHDLRNPLTSIRCSLGIVQAGMAGAIPEAAQPLLEIALQNCERMVRMLDEIREAGAQDAKPLPEINRQARKQGGSCGSSEN